MMNQEESNTESISKYLEKLVNNPEQPEIYFKLGGLYREREEWQNAIAAYKKAIEYNYQVLKAYHFVAAIYGQKLNDSLNAADYWYETLKLEPSWLKVDNYLNLANTLVAQKKLKKAVDCYRKAIAAQPDCLEIYHQLAELWISCNQHQKAIQLYRQGIQHNKQNSQFYFALSQALARKGNWKAANKIYQQGIGKEKNFPQELPKGLKFKPHTWEAYHQLGKVLQYKQQWETAILLYRQVNQLEPSFVPAYIRIGDIYRKLENHQLAFEFYRQAVEIAPKNTPLHQNAINSCQETLDSHPQPTADTYCRWGRTLRSQSLFPEAVIAYQQAIKLNPQFELPYIHLQYTSIAPEQLDSLIEFYRTIAQNHAHYLAWGNLGDALTEQNQPEKAIACYRSSAYHKAISATSELAKFHWKDKKEKPPDFLIIGAAKCGTSSLYNYLSQHPQVLFSHKKELDFFWKHFERGIDWYLSHFPTITDEPNFITGEATPNYLRFPIVAQRVRQYCPDIKLIILLRNPVERTVSWHYHKLNTGLIDDNLEDSITKEIQIIEKFGIEKLLTMGFYNPDNMFSSLYYYQIKHWLECFPSEQFLILKSEDFYGETEITMEKVFDFLGLPEHKLSRYPKVNEGSYRAISEELEQVLRDYFRPHNQLLEDYLDIKFNWGD